MTCKPTHCRFNAFQYNECTRYRDRTKFILEDKKRKAKETHNIWLLHQKSHQRLYKIMCVISLMYVSCTILMVLMHTQKIIRSQKRGKSVDSNDW